MSALRLPLPDGLALELDGPFDSSTTPAGERAGCLSCGAGAGLCDVAVVRPTMDEPPQHMLICGQCIAAALAVKLAARVTEDLGSTDWIAETGLPAE